MTICVSGLVAAHGGGKIASVISVESGHSIGTSLAVLRMYYRWVAACPGHVSRATCPPQAGRALPHPHPQLQQPLGGREPRGPGEVPTRAQRPHRLRQGEEIENRK